MNDLDISCPRTLTDLIWCRECNEHRYTSQRIRQCIEVGHNLLAFCRRCRQYESL